MDIQSCLLRLGYKAVVWGNEYGIFFADQYRGIKPHELETRPIPTLKELEAAWPLVQQDEAEKAKTAEAEDLINKRMREIAIRELTAEGTLTEDGKIALAK